MALLTEIESYLQSHNPKTEVTATEFLQSESLKTPLTKTGMQFAQGLLKLGYKYVATHTGGSKEVPHRHHPSDKDGTKKIYIVRSSIRVGANKSDSIPLAEANKAKLKQLASEQAK